MKILREIFNESFRIEHLEPEILEKVPANIFGNLKPKIVVITTPNREFNVLFPDFEGPFRHWDHKFEWDRAQFRSWAHGVVNEYPDYSVRFLGVGDPYTEAQKESHGFCSQIAVFVSKTYEASLSKDEDPEVSAVSKGQIPSLLEVAAEESAVLPYKIVNEQTYPCRIDRRSRIEVIGDESDYYVKQMAFYTEEWDEERDVDIKISELLAFSRLQEVEATVDEIRNDALEARAAFRLPLSLSSILNLCFAPKVWPSRQGIRGDGGRDECQSSVCGETRIGV